MRLPSQTPDQRALFRLMSLPIDDLDLTIISGEEYLRPMELESEDSDGVSPLVSVTSLSDQSIQKLYNKCNIQLRSLLLRMRMIHFGVAMGGHGG